MSIQRTSTSPAPLTLHWKYDVFLSFRGSDWGFTRNLYTALEHEGIRTFMDHPKLRKGEFIAPALLTAIEESRIAIIVLSKNYASSRWCLDELVTILECMKASETVLPVFYDVDPCEVRWQRGSFGEAFIKLEERFSNDKEKLLTWRTALAEVANLSGWTSNDKRYETELIRKIVGDIRKKLPPTSFGYAENLVGMDRILEPLHSLLGVGEDDVRFIGIWGVGGIGKITMVRAVKDKISLQFECSFLLSNVRDSIEKDGLLSLQKQLLKAMIQADQIDQIFDPHEAATALRRWLSGKKVLLIFDDVKDHKHLELLAGNQKWFGFGSRVLITTRDEHLLIKHGVERRLKVEVLTYDDSLQLFSRKAFKRSCPETDFLDLSRSVINYAKGLPLALEVLGSSLFGRDQRAWESALSQLGRVRNSEILDVLKISYKDLDSDGKKIFLDIACFFNGEDKGRITDVLTSCGFSAEFQIHVLMQRSLLIESYGRLWMHDLLQEMGHEIVHQESLNNELGRRSRLWHFEDVKYVLTKNAGTEAIEGIFVNSTHKSEAQVDVTPQSFSMMRQLRFLKINDVKLPNGLRYLPDSLRILDWKGYPSESLPSCFNPQNLLELILCHSCIKHFRIGTEPMRYLKTVNLSQSIVNTPTFEDMPNLEVLLLEGCISLCKVDPGIQVLKRLVELNLNGTRIRELPPSIGMLERLSLLEIKDCKDLVCLPSTIGGLKSLKSLYLSGCSKLDKLPDELGHIAGLEKLDVGRSGIREVPSSIGSLNNLKELSFTGCRAQSSKSWSMMLNPFCLLQKTSHSPVGLSLSCLSGFHSLTGLILSVCNLSEGAIPDLRCLASLERLDWSNISGSNDRRKLMYPLLPKLDYFSYQVVPSFSSVIHLNLRSDSVTSVYATESLPLTNRIEEIVNPDEETQGKKAEWVSSELHSPIVMVQDETEIETRNVVSEVDKSSSEHLERLVLYCSLFPEDFEFRKLELVQLWIAEGLDMKESDQETMEDAGIKHFNTLEGQGFLMHSRCDFTVGFDSVFSVPMYSPGDFFYKVNPVQLSVLEAKSSAANYFKATESKLEGASESTTQHLSFTYDDIDDVTFGVIPKFKNLRSLLLLCRRGGTIRRIPGDFFLSLNFLTTLKLSRTLISELPGSIGNVKALRYLDVSYTPIMRLPESIGSLEKLQTLILRGCMHLCDLPRSTHRLTALRHLDFDIIGQLDFMPAHLGNLTDLQTLSAFLVDQDDGRFIRELKNLNDLRGGICLLRLENVLSKADAEAADLPSKKALMQLDLQWTSLMVENVKLQEEILDSLRPHAGLRELQILFYNGTKLPAWLSRPSFTGLVVMTLYKCDNCELLPSIGQLPELKFLCIVEMNKVTEIDQTFFRSHNDPIVEPFNAFPKLEILELEIMLHLNEWKEIKEGDMPSLIKLTMESCPELVILPSFSRLKCLKYLEVKHCQKLMSLDRNGLPSSLDSLIIRDCRGLEEWSDMEGDQQFGPRAELC